MLGNVVTKIVAKNPATILTAIGGLGYIAQVEGAGFLLALGVVLNLVWLGARFV